jgi:probable F420-dependent oxidoreductase
MRHWLGLVNVPEFDQYAPLARAAEDFGFEGISLSERLFTPMQSTSNYGYADDGEQLSADDRLEPWIALTSIGAVTTQLQLASNIYLAALRNPLTVAKTLATAAVLLPGRVVLGVAAGWSREEYDAAGVDFATRGRRLDELLDLLPALWSGHVVEHHGEFFDYPPLVQRPAPPSKIPIWVGGASAPALRRAAMHNGWLPELMPHAQFLDTIRTIKNLRHEAGKINEPFDITCCPLQPPPRHELEELEAAGVTKRFTVPPWLTFTGAPTPWMRENEDYAKFDNKLRALERYAHDVIHAI